MPHLLLVDDDPEALEWLSEFAKAEGGVTCLSLLIRHRLTVADD